MVRQWRKEKSGLPPTAKGRPVVDGPSSNVDGPSVDSKPIITKDALTVYEKCPRMFEGGSPEVEVKQPVSDSPLCKVCKLPLVPIMDVVDGICGMCREQKEDKEGVCPDCGEANFPNMPNELCDECSLMDARGTLSDYEERMAERRQMGITD